MSDHRTEESLARSASHRTRLGRRGYRAAVMHRMPVRRQVRAWVGPLLVAVVMLTGCTSTASSPTHTGSSQSSNQQSPQPTTASSSPSDLQPEVRAALVARMTAASVFPGEHSSSLPQYQSAAAILAADPNPSDAAALRNTGLLGVAIQQNLDVPGTNDGVRSVTAFATVGGVSEYLQLTNITGSQTVFAVPGIPHAEGTDSPPVGGVVDRNVYFSVGRYEYAVGVALIQGSTDAPSRSTIIAVAQAWYDKVKSFAS